MLTTCIYNAFDKARLNIRAMNSEVICMNIMDVYQYPWCNTASGIKQWTSNLTPLPQDKITAISQTTFQMHFLECFVFWFKFHWRLFLRVQLTITQHCLDNGLAPNRRQAIIWTNAHPINWRLYMALGGDEINNQYGHPSSVYQTGTNVVAFNAMEIRKIWYGNVLVSFHKENKEIFTLNTLYPLNKSNQVQPPISQLP